MNNTTTNHELGRQFNSQIQKLKLELRHGLAQIDPLNKGELTNLLELFDQRLIVCQYDFLDCLAAVRGSAADVIVNAQVPQPVNLQKPLKAVAGVSAGIGGAHAAQTIVLTTKVLGHLWWQKTVAVTAAAWVAAHLGIPVAAAAATVGVFTGAAGLVTVKKSSANIMRRYLRRTVIRRFDNEVAPKLQAWAEERIAS
jgi:small basic protein